MYHLITFQSSINSLRAEAQQSILARLEGVDVSSFAGSTEQAAATILSATLEFFTETTLFGDLGHYVDCKVVEGVMYTTFELKALPGEGQECLYRRKRDEFHEAELANLETAMYSAMADFGITGTEE